MLFKYLTLLFITINFIFLGIFCFGESERSSQPATVGFLIHGGASREKKKDISPELEAAYKKVLTEALEAGYDILKSNGSSLDAVQSAIIILEDSPLFNAGKGAVFTNTGTNELDASLMDGKTLNAGAVSGVKRIKNPIMLARKVMENSRHLMMYGEGAEDFAKSQGIELVDPKYFYTKRRWQQLEEVREKEKQRKKSESSALFKIHTADCEYGTVGAVALDQKGNLAAGTSTGGMTNKRFGRIGDSPIIGAGTYADNQSVAVSASGAGEYFMRLNVAKDISALVKYKDLSVQEAADEVILNKLTAIEGWGGVICLDNEGNMAISYNSGGMFYGYLEAEGKFVIKFFE